MGPIRDENQEVVCRRHLRRPPGESVHSCGRPQGAWRVIAGSLDVRTGPTDGRTDEQTNRPIYRPTGGLTDGRTNGWTDGRLLQPETRADDGEFCQRRKEQESGRVKRVRPSTTNGVGSWGAKVLFFRVFCVCLDFWSRWMLAAPTGLLVESARRAVWCGVCAYLEETRTGRAAACLEALREGYMACGGGGG